MAAKGADRLSLDAQLEFLFEKWHHHDKNLHKRITSYWLIQTALVGILGLVLPRASDNFFLNYLPPQLHLLASGFVVTSFGLIGLHILRGIKLDRICRNQFNPELVQLLSQNSELLRRSKPSLGNIKLEFNPNNLSHPINNWHGQLENGGTLVSTGLSQNLIFFISWTEIVVGAICLQIVLSCYLSRLCVITRSSEALFQNLI